MAEYKIVSAVKTGEYESKFGTMHKYAVQFEGEADGVEISQKPTTPAPKAGDSLTGTIENTQYGKRFKKESQGNFGGGGQSRPSETTKQTSLKAAALAFQGTGVAASELIKTATELDTWLNASAPSDDKPPVESRQPQGDEVLTPEEEAKLDV